MAALTRLLINCTRMRLISRQTCLHETVVLLRVPGDTAVDRALNFGWRYIDEIWDKLQMLVVEYVLGGNGKLKASRQRVAEVSVHRVVIRNAEARQLINIPNRKVVLQLSEQIQRRPHVELVART